MRLGEIEFPYMFGFDCVDEIADAVGGLSADRLLVITDDTVNELHGGPFVSRLAQHAPVEVLSRPPGESMKSLECLVELLDAAISSGASRRSVVVAFGGGVPGNVAGMIAGSLFRGVRLVHVPTTTMAAMDSVISLKQAINSRHGKNHIGLFHVPEAVYVDVRMLQTLPRRELRSGLCEAAKNCLAIRPQATEELRARLAGDDLSSADSLRWLMEESIAAKAAVMRHDAHERGAGLILEYGHTVGHAVEMCDQRLRGAGGISHGEAIAFGMMVAARVSRTLGFMRECDLLLHEQVLSALGASSALPPGVGESDVLDVVRLDNKRGYLQLDDASVAMVLLQRPGVPVGPVDRPLTPVALDVVRDALETQARTAAIDSLGEAPAR